MTNHDHLNHDHQNPANPQVNEVEEIAYETRFLLNVLLDVLVKKNLITEAEFSKEYETILSKINQPKSN